MPVEAGGVAERRGRGAVARVEIPDRVPPDLAAAPPAGGLRRQLPHGRRFRSRALKLACVAADLGAISLGLTLAFVLGRLGLVPEARRPDSICLLVGLLCLPIWPLAFAHYRLYKPRFVSSRPSEVGRLWHAVLVGTLGLAALSFSLKLNVARSWLIVSFITVFVICVLERQAVRWTFDWARRRGIAQRQVLLVGTNAEAARLFRQLQSDRRLGYRIVGSVGDGPGEIDAVPHLGPVDDTLTIAVRAGVSGVIVATTAVSAVATNRLARKLPEAGLHVELSSALADVGAERLTVHPLGYFPMIHIEPVHWHGWRVVAKRAFDIMAASLGLLLLSPVLAVVAAWVKLTSKGPVLFRQTRVGRAQKPFQVLKFRTMVVGAEEMLADLTEHNEVDGPLFKIRSDPRITRAGRRLRAHSLDELPQLVNVLRGQMSLVGPRPALLTEMEQWMPDHRRAKLSVRPGLTGIWQVSGRSDLAFEDYVRLDLFYVQNWSLWRDLAIVARTIPVVFGRSGAY